jgi:hypothetical protein
MKMKLNKIIILIAFAINTLTGFSQIIDAQYGDVQPKENSPFSRFGLGNLSPQYFANTAGMGGMTAAYRDPYHYNPINPASLSSLRLADFDFGLYAKNTSINDGKNSLNGWSGNINHIALGFPTYSVINEIYDRKPREIRWAMGLALMPYNTMGYLIETQVNSPNNLNDSAVVKNFFVGSGGSYRLMWGNGVSYKGLSAGVNVGYLFGKMSYFRQNLLYDPNFNTFANNGQDSYTLGSFFWNVGLQYTITLDPKSKVGDKGDKKHIIIGGYTNPSFSMNTTASRVFKRELLPRGSSSPSQAFVISEENDIQNTGTLPSETTIGVNYENGAKFRGGIEYSSSSWSQYDNKADLRFEPLKNASQFSVGAEFVLNKSKLKPDEEKIHWRVGYRTGSDPRIFNGEQVKKSALTFGLGLPMRVGRGAQISFMDLGIEYGKIGTDKIVENFWRISLGFTLNDNSWFLKQRYQ